MHPYSKARFVLTSASHKELAIKPALEKFFSAQIVLVKSNAITEKEASAVSKAQEGTKRTGEILGLGSEGHFTEAIDEEILVLFDQQRKHIVTERLRTGDTNFSSTKARSIDELDAFLKLMDFPAHGLVVEAHMPKSSAPTFNGIQDFRKLREALQTVIPYSESGFAQVTTDMRAHMNPTRMRAIGLTAERLCKKLLQQCPKCAAPGFGVMSFTKGLPCETCHSPTLLARQEHWYCTACQHTDIKGRADKMEVSPQNYCTVCNP